MRKRTRVDLEAIELVVDVVEHAEAKQMIYEEKTEETDGIWTQTQPKIAVCRCTDISIFNTNQIALLSGVWM